MSALRHPLQHVSRSHFTCVSGTRCLPLRTFKLDGAYLFSNIETKRNFSRLFSTSELRNAEQSTAVEETLQKRRPGRPKLTDEEKARNLAERKAQQANFKARNTEIRERKNTPAAQRTPLEKPVKKSRGRPRLTDEEKAQKRAERVAAQEAWEAKMRARRRPGRKPNTAAVVALQTEIKSQPVEIGPIVKKKRKTKRKPTIEPAVVVEELRATFDSFSKQNLKERKPRFRKTGAKSASGRLAEVKKPSPIGSRHGYDTCRVNIVSEKLCDDIFDYIGSTLDRHKGCDILDISPGAGLWSRKLNDYLEPRSHILLEPDAAVYESSLLKPLLERPGTRLIPKSGILWDDLRSVLTPEFFPHQVEDPDRVNDTLLVTANLALHPRRKYKLFDSVATLVIYQFLTAIKTSSLFQKYGRVRMLLWVHSDDKSTILPRNVQHHRRTAVEGEIYCKTISEICAADEPVPHYGRDKSIDSASAIETIGRMKKAGFAMPAGRWSAGLKDAQAIIGRKATVVPGAQAPRVNRKYVESLKAFTNDDEESWNEEQRFRYNRLQYRYNHEHRRSLDNHTRLTELDGIMAKSPTQSRDKEIDQLVDEWDEKMAQLPKNQIQQFAYMLDNLHFWRQEPKLMHWDRRPFEPMVARPDEFYPQAPCTLLEITPGEISPLLREVGPRSNRAGDTLDLIIQSMFLHSSMRLPHVLESLWPGASQWIMTRCSTFRDPVAGGTWIDSKVAGLTPRKLNARQWEEVIECWMKWPFRPEYRDLVARSQDDVPDDSGQSLTDGD